MELTRMQIAASFKCRGEFILGNSIDDDGGGEGALVQDPVGGPKDGRGGSDLHSLVSHDVDIEAGEVGVL